jgi:hypothetical protein
MIYGVYKCSDESFSGHIWCVLEEKTFNFGNAVMIRNGKGYSYNGYSFEDLQVGDIIIAFHSDDGRGRLIVHR